MRLRLVLGRRVLIAQGPPPARWPMAGKGICTISRHRGHGPTHIDLLMGSGNRCPTIALRCDRGHWLASWLPAHRRRYLHWSGPVPGGRGVVAVHMRMMARWHRSPDGWIVTATGICSCRTGFPPNNLCP